MKKIINTLLCFTVLGSIFLFSCSKDDNPSSPTSTATCNQACQDGNVAYGVSQVFWTLWNQYFAGQPVGNVDRTVDGPMGGSVHFTGTTSYDQTHGITSCHLSCDMTGCKGHDQYFTLTFNGTVKADGSWNNSYTTMGYSSDALTYSGTVSKSAPTDVSGTCEIAITETQSTRNGTICGRAF